MSTTNNTSNATAPAANTAPAKPNPADLLGVCEYTLQIIGHPVHHTDLIAKIRELGLGTDKTHNANPRMWRDIQSHQEGSKFVLYGKSVFGLAAWRGGQYDPTKVDPNHYYPQRTTAAKVLDATALKAQAERLEKELAAAKSALTARLKEEAEAAKK